MFKPYAVKNNSVGRNGSIIAEYTCLTGIGTSA